ncbi:MAG: hypothetical protein ACJAYU_002621 [Bradymonadia bacterium]|jgi:hypothetical protein
MIVPENVDTLFDDDATLELYSLWSSDYDFAGVQDTAGELEASYGVFNQIVPLDEETLVAEAPVNLAAPVAVSTRYSLDHRRWSLRVRERDNAHRDAG